MAFPPWQPKCKEMGSCFKKHGQLYKQCTKTSKPLAAMAAINFYTGGNKLSEKGMVCQLNVLFLRLVPFERLYPSPITQEKKEICAWSSEILRKNEFWKNKLTYKLFHFSFYLKVPLTFFVQKVGFKNKKHFLKFILVDCTLNEKTTFFL